MRLRFFDRGQQVEQNPTGNRSERTLALLRIRNNPRFMFIHEGCALNGDMTSHKYYYEEHTCPINLMRCVEIIADGVSDPHGIFEIVEEHIITGPNAKPRSEILLKLQTIAEENTKHENTQV